MCNYYSVGTVLPTVDKVPSPCPEQISPSKEETKETIKRYVHIESTEAEASQLQKLPFYFPALMGCRSVENFEQLNRIEEGTYGVVFRAKDKKTSRYLWPCTCSTL